jgi:hypothetical protein
MINFGAHGPLADRRVMSAIIGHEINGVPATLEGYKMGVQGLDDIGVQGVIDVLGKAWGEGFEAYVLVPAEGENPPPINLVVYQLTRLDYDKVRAFELVDDGWTDFVTASVKLADGTTVNATVECLRSGQTVNRTVSEPLSPLIPVDRFIEHAVRVSMAPTMIDVFVIVRCEDPSVPSLGQWKQCPRRLHVGESTPLLTDVLAKVTRYQGGEADKTAVVYVIVDPQKYQKLVDGGWKTP